MSTADDGNKIFGLRRPKSRPLRFLRTILTETPFLRMVSLLVILWLFFSLLMYLSEHNAEGTAITSYGHALYWGIAAFSTAGIAETPLNDSSQVVGGVWIVIGSIVFFGTIVATVTTYFNRPMKRPIKQIIDTIEYNLEQMQDLDEEELDLLKETTDSLISHIEKLKKGNIEAGEQE